MSNNKTALQKLEKEREKLLEYLLTDVTLIKGSYSEVLVKCGKPGCHCEKKPIHLVSRLGIMLNKKVVTKAVRIEDRKMVQQLVENYRQHKKSARELGKVHDKLKILIKNIINSKNQDY